MMAIRYEVFHSTHQNLLAILNLIDDPKINRVILFATATQPNENFSESDGPDSNLPLMAVLAECKLKGFSPIHLILDGLFLTAARPPRYSEVRKLLDAAAKSQKVFFAKERAPFTSALSPDDAARELLTLDPFISLTAETRADYFALLSLFTEEQMVNL